MAIFEGVILVITAGILAWTVFTLRRHAKILSGQLEAARKASAMEGPGTDLEALFKWWAAKFLMAFTPCDRCNRLKVTMNLLGKAGVRDNIDELAGAIPGHERAE